MYVSEFIVFIGEGPDIFKSCDWIRCQHTHEQEGLIGIADIDGIHKAIGQQAVDAAHIGVKAGGNGGVLIQLPGHVVKKQGHQVKSVDLGLSGQNLGDSLSAQSHIGKAGIEGRSGSPFQIAGSCTMDAGIQNLFKVTVTERI